MGTHRVHKRPSAGHNPAWNCGHPQQRSARAEKPSHVHGSVERSNAGRPEGLRSNQLVVLTRVLSAAQSAEERVQAEPAREQWREPPEEAKGRSLVEKEG